jgi:hypothetical protein
VKVVQVGAGFKYQKNAFRTWGMLAATMTGYSSWAASPYNSDTDVNSAWLFNFMWIFLTWGSQLFFWIQKALFKSEGGAIHGWFIKMVGFSVINFAIAYWLADMLILRAILNMEVAAGEGKGSEWRKLGGLFILQIISTIIQVNNKSSLDFDYDLATTEPKPFKASTYVPETEFEDDFQPGSPENPDRQFVRENNASEDQISEYWGF